MGQAAGLGRPRRGAGAKLIAVPVDKLLPVYRHIKSPDDLAPELLKQIEHFFNHYKDLEPGKWVKTEGWAGVDAARAEIEASAKRYAEVDKG